MALQIPNHPHPSPRPEYRERGEEIERKLAEPILILGGNGMLAHALARTAKARGYEATVLARTQCDITRPEQIDREIDEYRPNVLLNCAAFTKVDLCETESELADAVNGHAVTNLLKKAGETGVKLVHFGSDFVFDGSSPRPYREEDSANPLSAYGRSKYLGESALLATLARTGCCFAPPGCTEATASASPAPWWNWLARACRSPLSTTKSAPRPSPMIWPTRPSICWNAVPQDCFTP